MNNDKIKEVGLGYFGKIYRGVHDEDAVKFLLDKKDGEIIGAINRDGFASIDLVYGINGENGYGLAHVEEQRPGFSILIPNIIKSGAPIYQSKDRVLFIHNLKDKRRVAVVRLDWNGVQKHWIVTGFGDI